MKRFAPLLLMVVLLALAPAGPVYGCPMCKGTLPEKQPPTETETAGAQGNGLAAGFYYSIVFMLATPFAMVGGFGGWLYLQHRKRQPAVPGAERSSTTG
ncbi:MAG: hypothetical protein R3336_04095 [Phycisphaeraceae bacterium]|nr:hypothetical protein [Phycisphaeraceae bacterium]